MGLCLGILSKCFGMCVFKLFLPCLCLVLCSCLAVAADISSVTYSGERLHINHALSLYSDDDKSLPVDRELIDRLLDSRAQEAEVTTSDINHLYVFDLVNKSESNPVQLEVKGSIVDQVELYVYDSEGLVNFDVSGYMFPRRGHSYVLNIPVDQHESVRVVLSLDSRYMSGPISVYLERPEFYQARSLNIYVVVYVCLGGMIFLGLYNLIMCLGLRDKSYLFYSLYLFSIVAGWSAVFSILMRHYEITNIGFTLLPFYLAPVFSTLFFISFLELKWERHKTLLVLSYIVIIFNAGMCLVFPFIEDFGFYYSMLMYNSGVFLLLALFAGGVRLLEGFKPARFFVLGFTAVAVGSMLAILPGLGVRIEALVEGYYVVTLLAQSLDMLFLAIALADKISLMRSEKEAALMQVHVSDLKVLEVEKFANKTLKSANEKLQLSLDVAEQQDKKKQHFLMLASHELKTPLNMVLQAVTELKGDAHTLIKQGVERLSMVVDEVTLFSQISTGELKAVKGKVSVDALFDDFLRSNEVLLKNKQVEVTQGVEDVIEVDGYLLNMVLKPLLDNACKFSKQRIMISYSYDEAGFARWMFEDDGQGLNSEDVPYLLQAFSQMSQGLTREKEGLGLGLYIVKKALQALGGKMEFSTSFGLKGACVEVAVPCEKINYGSFSKKEVKVALIVEDNPANAMVLSSILAKMEIESDVVINGQEALQILLDKKFDVVFMDLQMPVMNGLEATEELKKRSYPAPIIAVTADTDVSVREECVALGMADVLLKPIRLTDVKNSLLRLC